MFIRPDPLVPGAGVGIFMPASPAREPFRSRGLQALREMGLRPREVGDVFSAQGLFSRTPQQTIDDLQHFFNDGDIRALWAGRGGYGSNYLLPLLDRLRIPVPKIIIASSDVSYFLWYLLEKRKMIVFYGPMVYAGMADGAGDREQILAAVSPNGERLRFAGRVLCSGRASGLLTGGCLSNFISLLGTRHLPQLKKRILLLEDVNERPHRLDRMLWQCEQAGVFRGLRGLLLGEFPNCFRNDEEKEAFYGRWSQRLARWRIPVLCDMPFGHAHSAQLLPLGVQAEIDTESISQPLCCDIGVKW